MDFVTTDICSVRVIMFSYLTKDIYLSQPVLRGEDFVNFMLFNAGLSLVQATMQKL